MEPVIIGFAEHGKLIAAAKKNSRVSHGRECHVAYSFLVSVGDVKLAFIPADEFVKVCLREIAEQIAVIRLVFSEKS